MGDNVCVGVGVMVGLGVSVGEGVFVFVDSVIRFGKVDCVEETGDAVPIWVHPSRLNMTMREKPVGMIFSGKPFSTLITALCRSWMRSIKSKKVFMDFLMGYFVIMQSGFESLVRSGKF